MSGLRAAEFFAGIGLVRRALEQAGIRVVYANDIDPVKAAIYRANFGREDFVLADIAQVSARSLPRFHIATASFPCTDVSLAGNRAGLDGSQSGTFWRFTEILDTLGSARRPLAVLLENVAGFGTSKSGDDLDAAIRRLNELGYVCDVLQLNAKRWVPQSRPRVFVIGTRARPSDVGTWDPSELRPAWIRAFVEKHPHLTMIPNALELPAVESLHLSDVVERMNANHERWWTRERIQSFVASLSPKQQQRLDGLMNTRGLVWRTAYRRTRAGKPVWEVRSDELSGCLRTPRGGSSRQAIVEAGNRELRIRWMTVREYAALMGAADHVFDVVTENQAIFGFGDAVCVPAVAWLARAALAPLIRSQLRSPNAAAVESRQLTMPELGAA